MTKYSCSEQNKYLLNFHEDLSKCYSLDMMKKPVIINMTRRKQPLVPKKQKKKKTYYHYKPVNLNSLCELTNYKGTREKKKVN